MVLGSVSRVVASQPRSMNQNTSQYLIPGRGAAPGFSSEQVEWVILHFPPRGWAGGPWSRGERTGAFVPGRHVASRRRCPTKSECRIIVSAGGSPSPGILPSAVTAADPVRRGLLGCLGRRRGAGGQGPARLPTSAAKVETRPLRGRARSVREGDCSVETRAPFPDDETHRSPGAMSKVPREFSAGNGRLASGLREPLSETSPVEFRSSPSISTSATPEASGRLVHRKPSVSHVTRISISPGRCAPNLPPPGHRRGCAVAWPAAKSPGSLHPTAVDWGPASAFGGRAGRVGELESRISRGLMAPAPPPEHGSSGTPGEEHGSPRLGMINEAGHGEESFQRRIAKLEKQTRAGRAGCAFSLFRGEQIELGMALWGSSLRGVGPMHSWNRVGALANFDEKCGSTTIEKG
ncbi:hypothetical protein JHW43_002817 [Diplocarpon mali]|nr:hypothetical protein JHW43_002817 [Diplocarpon mali]